MRQREYVRSKANWISVRESIVQRLSQDGMRMNRAGEGTV